MEGGKISFKYSKADEDNGRGKKGERKSQEHAIEDALKYFETISVSHTFSAGGNGEIAFDGTLFESRPILWNNGDSTFSYEIKTKGKNLVYHAPTTKNLRALINERPGQAEILAGLHIRDQEGFEKYADQPTDSRFGPPAGPDYGYIEEGTYPKLYFIELKPNSSGQTSKGRKQIRKRVEDIVKRNHAQSKYKEVEIHGLIYLYDKGPSVSSYWNTYFDLYETSGSKKDTDFAEEEHDNPQDEYIKDDE